MKATCTFSVALLIQLIGHCSSMGDRLAISKASTSLERIPSITDFPEINVENVQWTENIDNEIFELQQQDFDDLKKNSLKTLFTDDELFPLSEYDHVIRAKDLVENPVLFNKNAKHFHVKQGSLGDCWFLVGLINLQFYENLFKFIVQQDNQSFEDDEYAGIFHLRFWQGGTWVDVVVDDRLPTRNGQLIYASSGYPNEFWPALIEKAYAKLLYRSYEKLNSGFASIAMQDLSGGITESFFVEKSASDLFEYMQDTIKKSTMIACGTYSEEDMTKRVGINTFDIDPGHTYAITDLKIVTKDNIDGEIKLIRICNPHGNALLPYPGKIGEIFPKETIESELKINVDGESWILYEDFIKYFESVYICNLTPNRIIGDIFSKKGGNKLSLSAFKGKWMGGIQSREVIENNFLKFNPQYRMVLKESNEGDKCNILIGLSLTSRHDSLPVDNVPISFQIIQYDEYEEYTLTKPLLDYSKEFIPYGPNGNRGLESRRFYFKPGIYYIVPFMKDAFKAANFFLQILSEQKDILEVYDRNIDMPNVKDKIQTLNSDYIEDADYQLFSDMSSSNNVAIDFKSLYNILKNNTFSLNKNCHIVHEVDDEIIFELDRLLRTKKFVPKKKLSIAKMAEIILNIEETFELYQQRDNPEYIHIYFIIFFLKRNEFFIRNNLLKRIVLKIVGETYLIHFNDLSLIVFTFKSQFGSYCEEFSVKLCRDLITMVHFKKSKNNDLQIDTQQFKMIIQFIRELKKIFYDHASASYRSVSFTKLRDVLDAFDYKLTYDFIATIFQKYGNDVDIFFHQFVQAVVDVTIICEKIQMMTLNNENINVNEVAHNMFHQALKKI